TEFIIINPTLYVKKQIIGAITQLFEDGSIQIVVCTISLFGQGLDAQASNTLVLASYVGSNVTFNQMRCWAIRINSLKHEKVANICHLACVDPTSNIGGADLETLTRRFNAFCGISLERQPYIQNGISRFKITRALSEVEVLNEKMCSLALNRPNVKKRWD